VPRLWPGRPDIFAWAFTSLRGGSRRLVIEEAAKVSTWHTPDGLDSLALPIRPPGRQGQAQQAAPAPSRPEDVARFGEQARMRASAHVRLRACSLLRAHRAGAAGPNRFPRIAPPGCANVAELTSRGSLHRHGEHDRGDQKAIRRGSLRHCEFSHSSSPVLL